MPTFHIPPDLDMRYVVDDYTDPWTRPESILLLHGASESGAAWYGWVPHLSRMFRLVRPDMRGFGQSTPMPRDFPWTLDIIIDDYLRLMDALDIEGYIKSPSLHSEERAPHQLNFPRAQFPASAQKG
jgi:pimeloyl-ACP methyl ester carboxylesterase